MGNHKFRFVFVVLTVNVAIHNTHKFRIITTSSHYYFFDVGPTSEGIMARFDLASANIVADGRRVGWTTFQAAEFSRQSFSCLIKYACAALHTRITPQQTPATVFPHIAVVTLCISNALLLFWPESVSFF